MRRGWFMGAAWEPCSPQGQPMWSRHLCSGNNWRENQSQGEWPGRREPYHALPTAVLNPHVLRMPTVQKEMELRTGCLSLRVPVTLGGAMVWCHYERRCQSQSLTWEAGIGLLYFLSLKQICIICTMSFKKKKGENAPEFPLLDIVQRRYL